jgi:hypothetical protein
MLIELIGWIDGFSKLPYNRSSGNYPENGVLSGSATNRKLYVVAHLDSLLEGRYPRLECLLKGAMNGSNCCRALWTC